MEKRLNKFGLSRSTQLVSLLHIGGKNSFAARENLRNLTQQNLTAKSLVSVRSLFHNAENLSIYERVVPQTVRI